MCQFPPLGCLTATSPCPQRPPQSCSLQGSEGSAHLILLFKSATDQYSHVHSLQASPQPSILPSIPGKGHFSEVEGMQQESLSQRPEAHGTSALTAGPVNMKAALTRWALDHCVSQTPHLHLRLRACCLKHLLSFLCMANFSALKSQLRCCFRCTGLLDPSSLAE